MCVIVAKPVGIELPSKDKMRLMFEANSDGAGFMYSRDGQVHIRKGFMKLKKLYHALEHEGITKKDAVAIHFRIATTGVVAPKNTHPFPLSDSLKEIGAVSLDTDVAMAHNGILSYPHDQKNDLSDTATFAREVLSGLKKMLDETPIQSLLEMAIGSNNKFVFLNKKGQFNFFGEWKKDDDDKADGCWYSNLTFKWRAKSYQSGTGFVSASYTNLVEVRRKSKDGTYEYSFWATPERAAELLKEQAEDKDDDREFVLVTPELEKKKEGAENIAYITNEDQFCTGKLVDGTKCGYPIDHSRVFCTKCGALLYNSRKWDGE